VRIIGDLKIGKLYRIRAQALRAPRAEFYSSGIVVSRINREYFTHGKFVLPVCRYSLSFFVCLIDNHLYLINASSLEAI